LAVNQMAFRSRTVLNSCVTPKIIFVYVVSAYNKFWVNWINVCVLVLGQTWIFIYFDSVCVCEFNKCLFTYRKEGFFERGSLINIMVKSQKLENLLYVFTFYTFLSEQEKVRQTYWNKSPCIAFLHTNAKHCMFTWKTASSIGKVEGKLLSVICIY
jgi:hypothetical protein